MNLVHERFVNQQLVDPTLRDPGEVVSWLGAVQAQDFAPAKWAVAQRTTGTTDAAMDKAFADGHLLRTHILRPTWHFVSPADIRWMLALTAPRVHALNAYYYRQLGLDETLFARTHALLNDELVGGRQRTRPELVSLFEAHGIAASKPPLRMVYLLMHAELSGLICSGALRGKQHTYALLDERAPQTQPIQRDDALAELTKRYFQSHGPATVKDFVWWSGLTVADANAGVEMSKPHLAQHMIEGIVHWSPASSPSFAEPAQKAYLLSIYDEAIISYANRDAILVKVRAAQVDMQVFERNTLMLVVNGQIVGTWRRTLRARELTIETSPFFPLDPDETAALEAAAAALGEHYGVPATLAHG